MATSTRSGSGPVASSAGGAVVHQYGVSTGAFTWRLGLHAAPLRTVHRMRQHLRQRPAAVPDRPLAVVELRAPQARAEDRRVEEQLLHEAPAQQRLDERDGVVLRGAKRLADFRYGRPRDLD